MGLVAAAVAGCSDVVSNTTDPFFSGALAAGGTTRVSLQISGTTRRYLLHLPADATISDPIPLLILLHGSGQTAEEFRSYTQMDSLADENRFAVAYPQGYGDDQDWNAGDCCGQAHDENIDDVMFVRAVTTDISAHWQIDSTRIYVGGFSDGARMAYRVGCDMASEIAGIAAVSGSLVYGKCKPARPIPVIAFHGTADPSVAYTEFTATAYPRVPPPDSNTLPPVFRFWMAANSCTRTSTVHVETHVYQSSGTGCKAASVFYSTTGGTHTWPGASPSDEIPASDLIAAFVLSK